MKRYSIHAKAFAGGLALVLSSLGALAQQTQPAPLADSASRAPEIRGTLSTTAAGPTARQAEPNPNGKGNAAIVDEILKMVQAGVSTDVVRTYIEHAPVQSLPSAAEIIALKEKGVPDELTVAFVKRGASQAAEKGRPEVLAGGAGAGMSAPVQNTSGGLDPESYDFWWYHYAYPRALASANETLLSSYWPVAPYSYGFLPPLPFPPRPAFRHFRLG